MSDAVVDDSQSVDVLDEGLKSLTLLGQRRGFRVVN